MKCHHLSDVIAIITNSITMGDCIGLIEDRPTNRTKERLRRTFPSLVNYFLLTDSGKEGYFFQSCKHCDSTRL